MNTPDINDSQGAPGGTPAHDAGAAEGQLAELLAAAGEAGVGEGDLDERIIDEHLAAASAVNNQGLAGQIRYLLDAYGAEAVRRDLLARKKASADCPLAIIIQDDRDAHSEDCDCGDHNSQGRSFGAAIFLLPEGTSAEEVDTAELRHSDPLERIYRASPETAVEAAREECRRLGIEVVSP